MLVIRKHSKSVVVLSFLCMFSLLALSACQDDKTKPDKQEAPIKPKKLTDDEFEKKYDLKDLLGKTLKEIPGMHGKSFETDKDCCEPSGKVAFTFDKAYSGEFTYSDKQVIGMYIKMSIQPDENCCKNIKIIQIKRGYETGKKKPKKLPGWKVDGPGDSPYASDYEFSSEGAMGKPATVFDIPGRDKGSKNKRVEYITIVLCKEPGKADKPLAHIHWGFDINENSEVKPLTPKAKCGAPDGLKPAVTTWNRGAGVIPGREKANIDLP